MSGSTYPDDMPSPKKTELQRLYSRPGFLLRRAHQISASIFERECEAIGVTPAQYSVLSALRGQDGLDQTTLARSLGFDKVTIVRVLHLMEERRLVERTRLATDRRANSLRLTGLGLSTYEQAQEPVERAYKTLLDPFNKAEQAQLMQLLERMITELDSHARAPLVRTAVAPQKPASALPAKSVAGKAPPRAGRSVRQPQAAPARKTASARARSRAR